MIHLGDITAIDGRTAPTVDVVIGGSPCQGLSQAGKRAGLADKRSGLFMEQIRIIKEMRQADAERGNRGRFIRPRYMVWENVVGALSSNKGADFRAVLEETAKIADPSAVIPEPPKGKWTTSGCVMGDGWSIAYRVLDAQFWGVPQRRRRIALVADFGGQSAPEISFIRKSVCGDIEPGQPEGEAPAPGTGGSADPAVTLRMRAGCDGGGKGALLQTEKSGTLACHNDQALFTAEPADGQEYPYVLTDNPAPAMREKVWSLQGNAVDREVGMNGSGISDGPTYTLNTVDRHAVLCLSPQPPCAKEQFSLLIKGQHILDGIVCTAVKDDIIKAVLWGFGLEQRSLRIRLDISLRGHSFLLNLCGVYTLPQRHRNTSQLPDLQEFLCFSIRLIILGTGRA